MYTVPWISVAQASEESNLHVHGSPFNTCFPQGEEDQYPSLITIIGRKKKSMLLSHALDRPNDTEINKPHKQVRLVHNRKLDKRDGVVVYIDCELQPDQSPAESSGGDVRSIQWLQERQKNQSADLRSLIVANIFNPISNVVCYIASDLQGLQGVALLLAQQISSDKSHTLPRSALPRVLVAVDTDAEMFDAIVAKEKLYRNIREALNSRDASEPSRIEICLASHFQTLDVVGLKNSWSACARGRALRRRLLSHNQDARSRRGLAGYLFNVSHIDAFADRMLTRFCTDLGCFNFIRSSRPESFVHKDFSIHLRELLKLLPSQSWLWSVAIPLVASTIFLANYPPGSHCKPHHLRRILYAYLP
jgi:hypothetical protein